MNFSVLMSVYFKDNPKFLEDAIESLLNQTVMPNEIVIVKDGKLTQELEFSLNKCIQKNQILYIDLFF